MNIRDRVERYDNEDVMIIGEIAEQALKTKCWELLVATIDSVKSIELQTSQATNVSSDKILGRLEAYEKILSIFNNYIINIKELRQPLEPEPEPSPMAIEKKKVVSEV